MAALAAAYQGDLDEAAGLNDRLAAIATSPTLGALHCYVAGEIDALADRTGGAEKRYEQAIALSRESGATFLEGIASVGLLTVVARAGRVGDALDGYRDLVDYWERTGGWIQQWTTLRNLAGLLRSLGDDEAATFLAAAADCAPDAPAVTRGDGDSGEDRLPPDRIADIRAEAAASGRAGVLDRARQSIERHRAAWQQGASVHRRGSP